MAIQRPKIPNSRSFDLLQNNIYDFVFNSTHPSLYELLIVATKDDPTSLSSTGLFSIALSKAAMMEEALTSLFSNLTNRNQFLKRQLLVPFFPQVLKA